jgi:hypothetical protein
MRPYRVAVLRARHPCVTASPAVLISLTVISAAEDATMGITWRELLAKIVVGVLIHFLISITATIAVIIPTTTTTFVSTVTVVTDQRNYTRLSQKNLPPRRLIYRT